MRKTGQKRNWNQSSNWNMPLDKIRAATNGLP